MELNQRKELFSKAYVRAVAGVAGVRVDQPESDDNSIDLHLTAVGIEEAAICSSPFSCSFSPGKYRRVDTTIRTGNVYKVLCLLGIATGDACNSKYDQCNR